MSSLVGASGVTLGGGASLVTSLMMGAGAGGLTGASTVPLACFTLPAALLGFLTS